MDRTEWLKKMRSMNEELYDLYSQRYWVTFGLEKNDAQQVFLQNFLARIKKGGKILSAGCGAGRHHGMLVEAGLSVTGIDQSEGMLVRARQHFPQIHFEKMGMQEISFNEMFDGLVCMDAMEHVCPEDYPLILRKFQEALRPGGVLYFTVEDSAWTGNILAEAFESARAQGLPVVFGEVVDKVEASYEIVKEQNQAPVDVADSAVYHYYPSLEQVREWLAQAGLTIVEEGEGNDYHHFVVIKV